MSGKESKKVHLDGEAYWTLYGIGESGIEGIRAAEDAFNLKAPFIIREDPPRSRSIDLRRSIDNLLANPTEKELSEMEGMTDQEKRAYAAQYWRGVAKERGLRIQEED